MNIYQKSVNRARLIASSMINGAKSGHTGISVGSADILFALFKDHLVFNPEEPEFENRDRFVLSAGHGAPILYTIMNMFGYDISINDLKNLRKYGSKTPGHPEYETTSGIEVSTGPLGQGVANAVGLAIASRYQGKKFNTINMSLFDSYTYCLCGDGCLMEGVANEACSLAGNLGLNKLILLYDKNSITIDGKLDISNSENVELKFKAMNWNVITVSNANNAKLVSKAIASAKKSKDKPTIIICKTKIGYLSCYEGSELVHGRALTDEELEEYKNNLNIAGDNYAIEQDVKEFCNQTIVKNKIICDKWHENFFLFEKTYPELFKIYHQFVSPKKIDFSKIIKSLFNADQNYSGRDAGEIILNEIASKYLNFIGGTADVAPSTKAYIDGGEDQSKTCHYGKNIRYGVREHAMGAITNGIALYSTIVPFCATFLAFSNYMIPAIRMGAMMGLKEIFIFSHDGLLVGEDGPTHQSVEQIAILRSIPNVNVFRPGNVSEVAGAFEMALNANCPTIIILSKGRLDAPETELANVKKGGYIASLDSVKTDVALYSSGIDLNLAYSVKKDLNELGLKVSVVHMPSFEVFEKQNYAYKKSVLNHNPKVRLAIECSNDNIWQKYIGEDGILINNLKYGKSGKGKVVYEKYGFATKDIVKKILEKIKK